MNCEMTFDEANLAACRGIGEPEIFAALPGTASEKLAKALCWNCPVREACLDEALGMADETTIRGGYTATERRAIMRERLTANA